MSEQALLAQARRARGEEFALLIEEETERLRQTARVALLLAEEIDTQAAKRVAAQIGSLYSLAEASLKEANDVLRECRLGVAHLCVRCKGRGETYWGYTEQGKIVDGWETCSVCGGSGRSHLDDDLGERGGE